METKIFALGFLSGVVSVMLVVIVLARYLAEKNKNK